MSISRERIKYSIIICTSGKANYLNQCLNAIKRNVPASNVEVIVVNNNPVGVLSNRVDEITNVYGFKFVHERRPGLTFARHRGINEALGEILSFIDDDVIVSEKWFDSLKDIFSNQEVVLAGGPSRPIFESHPKKWVDLTFSTVYSGQSICMWLSLLDLGNDIDFVNPNFIWGLNFNVRKNLIVQLGGFNPDLVPKSHERFQGDGETGLTQKIKDLGLRSDYRQSLLVNHVIPNDRLSFSFIKRRARYEGVCNAFSALRANIEIRSVFCESSIVVKRLVMSFRHFNLKFSCFVVTWELCRVIGYYWFCNVYKKNRHVYTWVHLESYMDAEYPL